jgi:hypothetical protein
LSEKITERVVPTAIDKSLEELAKPESQRDLATIMNSPAIEEAAHDVSAAVVRGVMDAITSEEYKGAFAGSGEKIGHSLSHDIAPGMATVARRTLNASLATTMSEENQERMKATVHGVVVAALAGTAEGLEHELGPAMARTLERDLVPAIARAMMMKESQQAIAMTTQQLAQHLVRGSSGEIDRVTGDEGQDGGFLGLLGGKIALGYAIAVFVAFAFGTLMVVLAVMLARSNQQRRQLALEGERREEAFMSLLAGFAKDDGSNTLTPEVRSWIRERMHPAPSP